MDDDIPDLDIGPAWIDWCFVIAVVVLAAAILRQLFPEW